MSRPRPALPELAELAERAEPAEPADASTSVPATPDAGRAASAPAAALDPVAATPPARGSYPPASADSSDDGDGFDALAGLDPDPDPDSDSEIDYDPADPFRGEDPDTKARLERILAEPFGYIAGDAGTGKSYLARRFSELYRGGELLATTGIAAVNIGGTTINSCLRYYDTESMQIEYEFGRLGAALRQLGSTGTTRLIIDEISMMDGRQLDILSLALDDANAWLAANHKPQLGIWLTGDFAQLPPVGVDKKKGTSTPPIYAFQSPAWSRWGENQMLLTDIRRQADPAFIAAIQQLRKGNKGCVDYFRIFIHPTEISDYNGTSILAKNDEVDRYNRLRMLRLQTPVVTFKAVRTGAAKDQPSEWKNVPETLELKEGALVMVLANAYDGDADQQDRRIIYANGDLGIFQEKLSEHHAVVRLHRTGREIVVGNVVREKLVPGARGMRRKKGKPIPPEKILASLDYMPLRVAYASTVHKSQGLSLDNVQLMINSQFWMSSGMLYVGVSRARTPEGLRIVGTPDQFAARVRANALVTSWL
jgi:ATP-dependent DNA helicase PIF1